jgi:hypothetical protein
MSVYFLWARRLLCNVFPFPVCKAQLIGDWYVNRRGAPNTIIFLIFRQYYWRTDEPCANRSGGPQKKKKLLAHCAGQHCLLAERDIGAPIYWRTDVPSPLLLADQTQKMHRNVRILSRQVKKNKKRRTEQFNALRLFSSQSPINLALQTGNGNTLKKKDECHIKN